MTLYVETLEQWARGAVPLLLDSAVKGAVLLVVAAGAVAAMRRTSAAARQLVCLLALGGALAMPLLSAALPGWRVLPGWARLEAPGTTRPAPQPAAEGPVLPFVRADGEARAPAGLPPADACPEEAPAARLPCAATADFPSATVSAPVPPPQERPSLAERVLPWAVAAWAAGVLVCLAPLVLGRVSLWRLARRSWRVVGGEWEVAARQAADAVGLRRSVIVLQSDREPMPMVWGLWRPRLLVPAGADGWSAARRRVVLLHELAHARRGDCLAKFVAHLACAAYWFNPLCWIAYRRMQAEAEAACDDLVLASGQKPSDYATHVLEIASGLRAGMLAAYASVAMARRSKLEGRLRAILDGRRNRRALTRLGVIAAAAVVASVAVPMSVLKATGQSVDAGQTWNSMGASDNAAPGTVTYAACDPYLAIWYDPPFGDDLPFTTPQQGAGTVNPEAVVCTIGVSQTAMDRYPRVEGHRDTGQTVAVAIDSDDPKAAEPQVIRLDFTGKGRFAGKPSVQMRLRGDSDGWPLYSFRAEALQVPHGDRFIPVRVAGYYLKRGGQRVLKLEFMTCLEGKVFFGPKAYPVRIVDGNGNFRLGDQPEVPERVEAFWPWLAGDTLAVDTGDGTFTDKTAVQRVFYGQPVLVDGTLYDVRLSEYGSAITARPIAEAGHLQVDADSWYAIVLGQGRAYNIGGTKDPVPLPPGKYKVFSYRKDPKPPFDPRMTKRAGTYRPGPDGRPIEFKVEAGRTIRLDLERLPEGL